MSQTIDPVASPEAYRASLLAALGDDDPAIAQAETVATIRALIADAGDRLRVRPKLQFPRTRSPADMPRETSQF